MPRHVPPIPPTATATPSQGSPKQSNVSRSISWSATWELGLSRANGDGCSCRAGPGARLNYAVAEYAVAGFNWLEGQIAVESRVAAGTTSQPGLYLGPASARWILQAEQGHPDLIDVGLCINRQDRLSFTRKVCAVRT